MNNREKGEGGKGEDGWRMGMRWAWIWDGNYAILRLIIVSWRQFELLKGKLRF